MPKEELLKALRSDDSLKDVGKEIEDDEPEVREIRPGVAFHESKVPEQEGWEVGEQYQFTIQATLMGIHAKEGSDDKLYEYKVDKAKGEEISESDKGDFDIVEKAMSSIKKDRERRSKNAEEKEIRVKPRIEPSVG